MRDRHFFKGGSELTAPNYIYFDKMSFIREFSIRKENSIESPLNDVTVADISPEPLIYEENKDQDQETHVVFDYTEQFLELVKHFPVLYDENSEMRKYRSKDVWKKIAENLSGKFTCGQLRQYWTTLMRKYKLYLEHSHHHSVVIDNEFMFKNLSFVDAGINFKDEKLKISSTNGQYFLHEEGIDENKELQGEINNEIHLLCEVEECGIYERHLDR